MQKKKKAEKKKGKSSDEIDVKMSEWRPCQDIHSQGQKTGLHGHRQLTPSRIDTHSHTCQLIQFKSLNMICRFLFILLDFMPLSLSVSVCPFGNRIAGHIEKSSTSYSAVLQWDKNKIYFNTFKYMKNHNLNKS